MSNYIDNQKPKSLIRACLTLNSRYPQASIYIIIYSVPQATGTLRHIVHIYIHSQYTHRLYYLLSLYFNKLTLRRAHRPIYTWAKFLAANS